MAAFLPRRLARPSIVFRPAATVTAKQKLTFYGNILRLITAARTNILSQRNNIPGENRDDVGWASSHNIIHNIIHDLQELLDKLMHFFPQLSDFVSLKNGFNSFRAQIGLTSPC